MVQSSSLLQEASPSFAYVSSLAPSAAAPSPLLRGLHVAVAPLSRMPELVLPQSRPPQLLL